MNTNPRKIHYDHGNHRDPHGSRSKEPLLLSTNEKEVTCSICRRKLGLLHLPTEQPMSLILPPITQEQEARYHERKAAENKLREQFREQNWRQIDGLPPEEMERIRMMMHGEQVPSPDPTLRKLGRPPGARNKVPRKDPQ